MTDEITLPDLIKKVKQQEDTVVQLLKIIAATNNRISELQSIHNSMSEK